MSQQDKPLYVLFSIILGGPLLLVFIFMGAIFMLAIIVLALIIFFWITHIVLTDVIQFNFEENVISGGKFLYKPKVKINDNLKIIQTYRIKQGFGAATRSSDKPQLRLYLNNDREIRLLGSHTHDLKKNYVIRCPIFDYLIHAIFNLLEYEVPLINENFERPNRKSHNISRRVYQSDLVTEVYYYECFQCMDTLSFSGVICNNCGLISPKCVICFLDPEPGDKIISFDCCKSYAHVKHAKSWLDNKKKCPYCGTYEPKLIEVREKLVT